MKSIGIVGAGRLGKALALGLTKKGFKITGIASRSNSSFEILNKMIGIPNENSLYDVVLNSDIIAITVSDSEIENVSREISMFNNRIDISNKIFLHFSGSVDSDALITLRHKDAFTGSLHPIQTFTASDDSWKGLEGIYYGFEGDKETEGFASELVNEFNGKLLIIEKNQKALYHAACCIISNYTVTLSYIAEQLFGKIGISSDVAEKALEPLLENTAKNISQTGSVNALTGPVSRGDSEVIEKHIEALKSISEDDCEAYKILAKISAQIALKKGTIDINKVNQINEIVK
ncbi:MAG: Rossmann-like and DUF2520 domain-containing protein [Clostridia bacterium]|jgi:predicted short-subunit dehydrogenase-like oxidoreductase (DUF2520 family)